MKVKVKGNSLAGQSVLDVDTHKRADEVFRFFADVVPVGRVELKLPWKKGELYRSILRKYVEEQPLRI